MMYNKSTLLACSAFLAAGRVVTATATPACQQFTNALTTFDNLTIGQSIPKNTGYITDWHGFTVSSPASAGVSGFGHPHSGHQWAQLSFPLGAYIQTPHFASYLRAVELESFYFACAGRNSSGTMIMADCNLSIIGESETQGPQELDTYSYVTAKDVHNGVSLGTGAMVFADTSFIDDGSPQRRYYFVVTSSSADLQFGSRLLFLDNVATVLENDGCY